MDVNIGDLPNALWYFVANNQFNTLDNFGVNELQFSYGTQKELVRWMVNEDKDKQGDNAFGELNRKYPLVWMGSQEVGTNNGIKKTIYEDVRLIFACNTESEYFNKTRHSQSIPKLKLLAGEFIKLMSKQDYLDVPPNREGGFAFRFETYPNYSQANKNDAIDIWDAVAITLDIYLDETCINFKTIDKC